MTKKEYAEAFSAALFDLRIKMYNTSLPFCERYEALKQNIKITNALKKLQWLNT